MNQLSDTILYICVTIIMCFFMFYGAKCEMKRQDSVIELQRLEQG